MTPLELETLINQPKEHTMQASHTAHAAETLRLAHAADIRGNAFYRDRLISQLRGDSDLPIKTLNKMIANAMGWNA
jgi:hypothetical protein